MLKLGLQLKAIRENLGLTLKAVSKDTAIDFTALSRIEKDERKPTQKQIELLAQYYNIPAAKIRTKILAQKIAGLLSKEDDVDEIFLELKILLKSTNSEQPMETKRKRPYMGLKGETFFIRSSGLGEFKSYHLINKKNFDMIEMSFETQTDAKNYAKKRDLKIETYKDQ